MPNEELTIYDRLLQFVLFQGMSRSELLQLAGNTRFGFVKMPADKVVVSEGDVCDQLWFLVDGTLAVQTSDASHSFKVVERFSAPWLYGPESLFGVSPRYRQTLITLTTAHFITLTKDEVLRLLDDFLIFRLNLLNFLSTLAQRQRQRQWMRAPQTLDERIVRFFVEHTLYPAGHKEFYILMQQLATEVGVTRLRVSDTLNQLQQKGYIVLRRGCIEIPMLEYLIMG